MVWWGKIIGGGIGAMIGGPIGASIGAVCGHQLDRKGTQQEKVAAAFMYTLIAAMAKMAKADGIVSSEETDKVFGIFKNMGLETDGLISALSIFKAEEDSDTHINDYLTQYYSLIQGDHQMATELYYILLEVAKADGRIHPAEKNILLTAERILRLPPGTTEALFTQSVGMTKEAAAKILEVLPDATKEDTQSAYRKKCKEMHPDKLSHKGLPQELIEYANAQMSRYTDARDAMLNS